MPLLLLKKKLPLPHLPLLLFPLQNGERGKKLLMLMRRLCHDVASLIRLNYARRRVIPPPLRGVEKRGCGGRCAMYGAGE
jgi:hypothetical protein